MRTEYNNYASQALEKAAQDAASCHQKYIGTEHLILGLLAQPDSLSDEYFMRMVLTMRIF